MALVIGIDVGGTKIAGGVVDEHGRVLARTRRDTPADDVAETRSTIVAVVAELASAFPVTAVGVGTAGWVDATGSTVLFAAGLPWHDEPLRDYVSAAVGMPTVVENDANAAAWAEYRFGSAKDAGRSMAMVTVGTGIGGGIVIDGELWRGFHGTSGELGHMRVVADGYPCGCGALGCLDQYASGRALVRFAVQGAARYPGRAALLLELAGGRTEAITGPMISVAARRGDAVALDAFAAIGRWLGGAMADLARIIDPQVLVVGGGIIEAGELLLDPTERAYRKALHAHGRHPAAELRPAQLGPSAGMIGAADLARRGRSTENAARRRGPGPGVAPAQGSGPPHGVSGIGGRGDDDAPPSAGTNPSHPADAESQRRPMPRGRA